MTCLTLYRVNTCIYAVSIDSLYCVKFSQLLKMCRVTHFLLEKKLCELLLGFIYAAYRIGIQ